MTEPIRVPLPERRRSVQWRLRHGDVTFYLTFSYYPDGRVGDVFAAGGYRQGSEMQHTVDDACIAISIMLQHGVPPEALVGSLGTVPCGFNGESERFASIIGVIVDAVIRAKRIENAVPREAVAELVP